MNLCVQTRLRVALGTFVAIEAHAGDAPAAQLAIGAAFDAIAKVQRLMHPSGAGSDLAALAGCRPGGASLTVDPWTWQVLHLSKSLHRSSEGIFDPCLSASAGRLSDLELCDRDEVAVHAPLLLDLGGIAKGFAVDCAIEALRSAGCEGGLVNAGGDVAAFGARAHWIFCGGARVRFKLREAALATSDTAASHRPSEHRGYYHGADRTVLPRGSATVIAPRAAVADGLTKCLLCADAALAAQLLHAFDAQQLPVH